MVGIFLLKNSSSSLKEDTTDDVCDGSVCIKDNNPNKIIERCKRAATTKTEILREGKLIHTTTCRNLITVSKDDTEDRCVKKRKRKHKKSNLSKYAL